MKTIAFLICIFTFSTVTLSAQNSLANTKWAGMANIPSPLPVVFEFGKDSLAMKNNNDVLELMQYSIRQDSLIIKKISGMSPCGDTPAYYKFSIKNNTLFIEPVADSCPERSSAFTSEGYKEAKQ